MKECRYENTQDISIQIKDCIKISKVFQFKIKVDMYEITHGISIQN